MVPIIFPKTKADAPVVREAYLASDSSISYILTQNFIDEWSSFFGNLYVDEVGLGLNSAEVDRLCDTAYVIISQVLVMILISKVLL